MVEITLEPLCLDCRHLEIVDRIEQAIAFDGSLGLAYGVISCAHSDTCKFIGDSPNISEIIRAHRSCEGGE